VAVSGSAARRYAEALIGLAEDDRGMARFRESLERIATALDRQTIAALRNPAVPMAKRRSALDAAIEDEPAAVRSLFRLLLERDRISLAPDIARAFGDIVDQREGIAKVRITTAVELKELEREGLARQLERASGKKIRATFAVDPTLVGGAKVQIGDHLIDSSLSGKLTALGRHLVQEADSTENQVSGTGEREARR
jgi:F-type H+-transporting ATPase subunit delta